MTVRGKILPLRSNIIVSNMDFDNEVTASGIVVTSDNGKTTGIHPRWGKVFAIGPDQKDIKVGEWVLVEHGRWTRTIKFEQSPDNIIELRMVEEKSVLATADERPADIMRS